MAPILKDLDSYLIDDLPVTDASIEYGRFVFVGAGGVFSNQRVITCLQLPVDRQST